MTTVPIILKGVVNDGSELELRDPYIELRHAMGVYSYSRSHLCKLVREGTVRSVKLGGSRLLLSEDIEEYTAGREDRKGGNMNRGKI